MNNPDATTYPAGTVAVATVRGVPSVRVIATADPDHPWLSGETVACTIWHRAQDVTDARPLTVLDLPHPAHTVEALREAQAALPSDAGLFREVADQIEAQHKPPRIPEPGLWGVVEAHTDDGSERRTFVRCDTKGSYQWMRTGVRRKWEDLIDPVQVRPGVDQ